MSEQLHLETVEPGRRSPINPRFVIAAVGILAVVLLGVALVVFVASRQGRSLLPALGGQKPKPTATVIIKATATATQTPPPSKPSPTPPPTLGPTNTPTPLPPQIIVEGASQYPRGLPYLAEYKLAYSNGGALTATVTCTNCLMPSGTQPPLAIKFSQPGAQTMRTAVMAGDTATYVLRVNGSDCLAWNLAPGDGEKAFRGVCVVTRP